MAHDAAALACSGRCLIGRGYAANSEAGEWSDRGICCGNVGTCRIYEMGVSEVGFQEAALPRLCDSAMRPMRPFVLSARRVACWVLRSVYCVKSTQEALAFYFLAQQALAPLARPQVPLRTFELTTNDNCNSNTITLQHSLKPGVVSSRGARAVSHPLP
eukprot:scaffold28626_cov107-Isochrysis_galbana.AAC.2